MSDALELRAWRFLASHRVGTLKVTHIQFIDNDGSERCRMNTPSVAEYYEDVASESWGNAAISLATALGMPCEDGLACTASASGQDSNFASTAIHRSGASELTSPAIRSAPADSTTVATGAAPDIGTQPARAQRAEEHTE
jgi:hypothetical protein